jgi:hypothetical protein
MTLSMFYGFLPFFLSAGIALALALTYKATRKRYQRRSPLHGRKVGKLPGEELVVRISHHETELLAAVMLMYMALPIMFMTWASQHIDWNRLSWGSHEWIFLIGATALFGYGMFDYIRNFRARENARDGLLAERVTGMQLNRLVTQGCLVLHDLPADNFNIDHVVIAPRAVYAVETKSFRKPRNASEVRDDPSHHVRYDGRTLVFPDFATREPIEQAVRQAQWLRRVLRDALGREFVVIPVVALPGWYIDRSEDGKRADVQVFTPMGKGAEFMAWVPERIALDHRRVIAETLAARYPVIDA